jgi:hypothetical protein
MRKKKWPVLPPDSRWKIIEEVGRDGFRNITYKVQCSCPAKTIRIVASNSLSSGNSKSCGCLKREVTSRIFKKWPILPPDSRWTILKESGKDKWGAYTYKVQCSCPAKTIRVVAGSSLSSGDSKSCGCLKREVTSRIFKKWPILPPDSRWTILGEARSDGRYKSLYHVQCSCPAKTMRVVAGNSLSSGNSKSCGCLKREVTSRIFKKWPILPPDSRWTVLSKFENHEQKRSMYLVQCSCSEKTKRSVLGTDLSSGNSKSCGCLNREVTSRIFKKWPILPPDSRWTILKESGKNKWGAYTYKVQCSCPAKTIRVIFGGALTQGKTKSCGCLRNERVQAASKKRIKMSDVFKQFGHLTNIEETIENIQKEIDPCDSESTSQKTKPSKRPKRSSAVSSTG